MKMHESFRMKLNPAIEISRLREALTVADAVNEFIRGYTGGGVPSTDEVKEYLVSTGVVTVAPADTIVEQLITEALEDDDFMDKTYDEIERDEEDELYRDRGEDEDDSEEMISTGITADDLQPGDLLDMGEYGDSIIFINDYDGSRFWGTDNVEDFRESGEDASGWYFEYADIQDILGNVHDDDDELDESVIAESMFATSVSNQPTGAMTTPGFGTPQTATDKANAVKAKIQTIQKTDPNVDPTILGRLDEPALDTVLDASISKKVPSTGIMPTSTGGASY